MKAITNCDMIFSKTNLCEGNMKKWKNNSRLNIVLAIMSVVLIILLAPITMPLMFLGGVFGIWYFAKRNPSVFKRNIAIAAAIIGILGSYTVSRLNFESSESQQSQTQVVPSTSRTSSSNSSKASSSSSNSDSSREKEEKLEKEKKEKKAEEERKQKEAAERKAKEEQAQKEAQIQRITQQGEQAVKQLEDNQVAENIAPAQAAVEQITDPNKKGALQHRINLVQNAIQQRAEQARQEAERQAASQQEETVAASGYFRDKRGRWHRPNGQYASKKEIAEAGLPW
nr:mitofilin family membrane protein [Streptococcus constellatus]